MRRTGKYLKGVAEREVIQNVAETIGEKIMAKKFLELIKCTNAQIQGDL